jgi:hypothetical protein
MKKVLSLIAMVAMFSVVGYAGNIERTYTMRGTIADNYTVIDERGEAWGFDTNLSIGTPVTITFYDSETINYIYDDIIINVK